MKRFIHLDAGEMREALTLAAIDWLDAGFKSSTWVACFERRVQILAKRIGLKRDRVYDEIMSDARIAAA